MGKRKVIQVFSDNDVLYFLCDDGSVWYKAGSWYRLDLDAVENG